MILNSISNSSYDNSSFEKTSIRKLEYQERTNSIQNKSIVDQSLSYAKQLSASRTKAKETSLQKKKLQYNFKKISSQIIRSKDSNSARRAVQAAKREVVRLKRLKACGEYDEEELQLAIDHAKAMEKVAKKKVVHLEQEEMIERGSGAVGALEEVEKEKDAESPEEPDEGLEDVDDIDEEELIDEEVAEEELLEDMAQSAGIENVSDMAEMVSDSMSEMMDEFSKEMLEMMEDLDLSELAESTYAPDPNMSADDLKMLKIKHRFKELKEIAEADKDYLKGMMEYENKTAAAPAVGGGLDISI